MKSILSSQHSLLFLPAWWGQRVQHNFMEPSPRQPLIRLGQQMPNLRPHYFEWVSLHCVLSIFNFILCRLGSRFISRSQKWRRVEAETWTRPHRQKRWKIYSHLQEPWRHNQCDCQVNKVILRMPKRSLSMVRKCNWAGWRRQCTRIGVKNHSEEDTTAGSRYVASKSV